MSNSPPASKDFWASFATSAQEYGRRVWQRGWVLIVSGIGGVLTLISATVTPGESHPGQHAHPIIPLWLGLTLLIGGIMVAQFLAFHDVRKERDTASRELTTRLDALWYRFDVTGIEPKFARMRRGTNGELEQGWSFWLTFTNGAVDALEYEIEMLSVVLDGRTTEHPLTSPTGVVLPGRDSRFHYSWLPCPLKEVLDGFCEYTIVYRHPTGGPAFRTHAKLSISLEVNMEEEGKISWTSAWVLDGNVTHDPVATPA